MRSGLTLYSFTYAGCDDECAQTPQQIAHLRRALGALLPQGVDLSFITISLNPAVDTPEVLHETMSGLSNAADDRISWQFVTGDPVQTKYAVGSGFNVYYGAAGDADEANTIVFDPRYVLVDSLGIIRAEYRTATPDPALLQRDINLLIKEAENSEGVARLGYEAAHLFLCYPR